MGTKAIGLTVIQIALAFLISTLAACAAERTVRLAAVHFEPVEGDVKGNVSRLVQLTREAAQNGATIVVHTEMATSGYSFFK